ncbi:MAG: hypothetical protein C4278_00565 [Patescibacteria group bacterium]
MVGKIKKSFIKMPKTVQKRGNRGLEEFKEEKLKESIRKAGLQAGFSQDQLISVVEEVAGYVMENLGSNDQVDTQEIRRLALSYLKEKYPEIYQSWVDYDKAVKGREDAENL